MNKNLSYTIEEVAQLLKISKLTVYDLVKKGDLVAYRVGRQMRVEHDEIEKYKSRNRTSNTQQSEPLSNTNHAQNNHIKATNYSNQVVISGQDIVLDMLSKYIEEHTSLNPLRSYNGSLNSLISMYNGECEVVSVHLYDGDTGEYNLPYVKRILVNSPFILINLVCRKAGIYVKKGNPLNINSWEDLAKANVKIANREKGSGARVLLDEQLRINNISHDNIIGYDNELTSHFSVASAVASGQADAGVGIENVTKMVNVEFIPLITEQYDLVVLKTKNKPDLVEVIKNAVSSPEYRSQLEQMHGYDLSLTGKIIYES